MVDAYLTKGVGDILKKNRCIGWRDVSMVKNSSSYSGEPPVHFLTPMSAACNYKSIRRLTWVNN